MANNWNLGLVSKLDGTKSKNQLNQDIQALQKVLNSVELKAKLDPNQVKSLENQLSKLQVSLTDVTIPQSVLNGLVNQINNALQGIQIPNINFNPSSVGNNLREVLSDEMKDALKGVTSPELEVGFHVDPADSGKFEKEVSQIITDLQKQDATAISYRLNTHIEVDKDSGERIEHLKNATFQFTTATGESIRKTIEFNEALNTWGEGSASYSKTLDTMSAKTDTFLDKQKDAVTKYQIELDTIKSRVNDKGVGKPIKDKGHISSLATEYTKVETAISNLSSANKSTFTDMKNAVQKAIAELENLERQYRNAETVASSLRAKDFDATKGIQQESLTDFIEKVKNSKVSTDEFNQGLVELHQNMASTFKVDSLDGLQTFLDGITKNNPSELVEFLNMLDLAKAKLKSMSSEKTTENTSAKITADADKLKSTIESFKSANPAIETWTHKIGDAKFSVAELINRLEQVGSSDDVRVIAKQFDAFKEAAEKAGVATKATVSEYETLLKKANEAIGTNKYIGQVAKVSESYEKIDDSLIDEDLKKDYGEIISLSEKFNSSLEDKEKVATYKELERLIPSVRNRITELSSTQKDLDKVHEIQHLFRNEYGASEYGNQIREVEETLKKYGVSAERVNSIVKDLNDTLAGFKVDGKLDGEFIDSDKLIAQADLLESKMKSVDAVIDEAKIAYDKFMQPVTKEKASSLIIRINNFLSKNKNITEEAKEELLGFVRLLQSGNVNLSDWNKFDTRLKEINIEMREANRLGKTLRQTLVEGAKSFIEWTVSSVSVMEVVNGIKKVVDNVVELDDKLLELDKVSDLTAEGLKNATKQAYELGEHVGKTGTQVVGAVTEFKRAGYDLEESFEMAEAAMVMTNVAEGITETSDAAGTLISILKGFNMSESSVMSIVDMLNSTSNQSPIGFDELAEGLERTAGTLAQSGTSIQQTIGLITAGYAQLRNVEKVSTSLITLSARLRGVNEDGEVIEGLSAELQKSFGDIGVEIENADGSLRNIYEIAQDYAKVLPTLTDKQKQYYAELAAGKRNVTTWNAITQQFQDAENATAQAIDSVGSASVENAKYLDSIGGKISQFKSSAEQLSNTLVNSGLVKFFVDLGTGITNAVDGLINFVGIIPTIGAGAGIFEFFKNLD